MEELIDIYNKFLTMEFIPELTGYIFQTICLSIILLILVPIYIKESKDDKNPRSKRTAKGIIVLFSFFLTIIVGIFFTLIYMQSNQEDINNTELQKFNKTLSYEQRSLLNQEIYFWLKEKSLLEACGLSDCDITLTKEELLSKSEHLYFRYETISKFFESKKHEIRSKEKAIKEETIRKSIQEMRNEILDLKVE